MLFLVPGNELLFPVDLDESIDVPHLHVPPAVLPGNAIAYAVIAHKSVPADFSHLKPVFGQTVRWRKRSKRLPRQPINRTFPGRPVNAPVLLVAPLPRLTVQVLHIRKPSARHEILLNESGGPFHLAFGLRTLDPANFGNHATVAAKSSNSGCHRGLRSSPMPRMTVFIRSVSMVCGTPPKYSNAWIRQRKKLDRKSGV